MPVSLDQTLCSTLHASDALANLMYKESRSINHSRPLTVLIFSVHENLTVKLVDLTEEDNI